MCFAEAASAAVPVAAGRHVATSSVALLPLSLLANVVVSLRALMTTHWETAAAFAELALRQLSSDPQSWAAALRSCGLRAKHVKWTLHTVLGRQVQQDFSGPTLLRFSLLHWLNLGQSA